MGIPSMCKSGFVVIVVLNLISGVDSTQAAGSDSQATPLVRVAKVNTNKVKKYEKFEIELALADVEVKKSGLSQAPVGLRRTDPVLLIQR